MTIRGKSARVLILDDLSQSFAAVAKALAKAGIEAVKLDEAIQRRKPDFPKITHPRYGIDNHKHQHRGKRRRNWNVH